MKYPAIVAAGLLAAVTLAGPASANNLQSKMESCLTKHANTRQAATITPGVIAAIGFRALGVNYESDGDVVDLTSWGPLAGLTIRF
jgi:hypothetical protein